jgi:hypothetical protein
MSFEHLPWPTPEEALGVQRACYEAKAEEWTRLLAHGEDVPLPILAELRRRLDSSEFRTEVALLEAWRLHWSATLRELVNARMGAEVYPSPLPAVPDDVRELDA